MTIAPPVPLAEYRKQRKPFRNIKKEHHEKMSRMDRLALWITEHVGTMRFFVLVFVWTFLWLAWNFLAPKELQFDPPMGFVFWLFISNVLQILLMPLIMVGQNIQGHHADLRAENDLEVNVKAEREIELVLEHLEYQNAILIAMLGKLGVDVEQVLGHQKPKSSPT